MNVLLLVEWKPVTLIVDLASYSEADLLKLNCVLLDGYNTCSLGTQYITSINLL